jgi:hypothetical protein
MPKNRQKLTRIFGGAGQMQKRIGGPEHGHHRICLSVLGEVYPDPPEPMGGGRCQGCNRLWSDLEVAGFMPICDHPADSARIVIEYADDPLKPPGFEAVQNEVEPMEGTPFTLSERPEGIVGQPLKPAQDDEVLIPSDAELDGMDEAQLDELIKRVEGRLQNGKN